MHAGFIRLKKKKNACATLWANYVCFKIYFRLIKFSLSCDHSLQIFMHLLPRVKLT